MAKEKIEMTFENYRKFLLKLQGYGYEFWTHLGFMELPTHKRSENKIILLRHDVDLDREMRAIERILRIETELDIMSTVFLRLHDPMYNVLGYRELSVIRNMITPHHEIGLHCETADLAKATGRSEREILEMDLNVLAAVVGKSINGVAAHGDITGQDNHQLIDNIYKRGGIGHSVDAYELTYHAYQKENGGPFSGWYISNYQGNNWKRYIDGVLSESEIFDFMQYAEMLNERNVQKCTFLIHPRPWHDVHYLRG